MKRTHAVLAGLACILLGGASAAQGKLPFAEWAEAFREEHGLAEASREGLALGEVLDSGIFARVVLGGFDLRIPTDALDDGSTADEFKNAAQVMVEVQRNWFLWRDPARSDAKQVADDWKTLSKWVKGWGTGKLARTRGGDSGSLYEELGAKDKVVEAQARLREITRPDVETIKAVGDLNVIVLLPERQDFLHFLAFAGWFDPEKQKALWSDAAIGQSQAWFDWIALVCMEFSKLPVDYGSPFQGSTQNLRQKTGQSQFMADRCAALLLRKEFWRHGTHFFETALGTNLVIAAVGENDLFSGEWKLEYRTSGSRTAAYTRFVPGGNPSGGVLPKRSAGAGTISGSMTEISAWRADAGRDFFLEALRAGQKAGAKFVGKEDKQNPLRKDKSAHFLIHSKDTGQNKAMTAPFLGPHAEGKALPGDEFLDDYEDFFRAYRSRFLVWLQDQAGQDEDASAQTFAALIQAQATRELGAPLNDAVMKVYDVPVSGATGDEDSLEWRYLAWLAKGR